MKIQEGMYGTDLQKNAGLVQETVALLEAWHPGMDSDELLAAAISRNLLGRTTSSRIHDIVKRGFVKRYLRPDERPARHLKILRTGGVALDLLRQLFFIHTARSQALLSDFMVEEYWRRALLGQREIENADAQRFIRDAFGTPKIPGSWADSVVTRIARGLTRALAEFGLLEAKRGESHGILPYTAMDFTGRYMCYEAHDRGVGDKAILALPEWGWFGMGRDAVPAFVSRLAASGHDFLFQYSGEIARFSWTHPTMEDFLNAHC